MDLNEKEMLLRLKLVFYVSLMFLTLYAQALIGLVLLPIWILLWIFFGISANEYCNKIQRFILDKIFELDK